MLVLSRKNLESFVIKIPGGKETIKVQVLGSGKVVKLGIDAPKEFVILRTELVEEPAFCGN